MRLAGQAKMGYYPTPDVVARRIGRALTRAGTGVIRTLDPCCGEGTALVLATEDLGELVERYGIELNHERAAAAKEKLTRVLRADLRSTRIANGAFGLVYLNPPYDFSVRTQPDDATERLELHFLQASLRYLQPQGTLVYLKGRTEKRSVRTETQAEDDTLVITDRDTLRIVITVLDLRTGKVRTME